MPTPAQVPFAPLASPGQELRRVVAVYGSQPVTHAALESLAAHLAAHPRPRLDHTSARRRLVGLWVGRGLLSHRDGYLVLTRLGRRVLAVHQDKMARAHAPARPGG